MSEKWVSNATTPKPWKLIAGDNYETKNFKYNNCNDDKNKYNRCNSNNNNIFNKKLMIIKIDIIDFYYWYHYYHYWIHNVFNFVCLTSA